MWLLLNKTYWVQSAGTESVQLRVRFSPRYFQGKDEAGTNVAEL